MIQWIRALLYCRLWNLLFETGRYQHISYLGRLSILRYHDFVHPCPAPQVYKIITPLPVSLKSNRCNAYKLVGRYKILLQAYLQTEMPQKSCEAASISITLADRCSHMLCIRKLQKSFSEDNDQHQKDILRLLKIQIQLEKQDIAGYHT